MASNFPTAYVRVASQTYVLQHIYIEQFSAKKLMLAGHGVCELPGDGLCLKYTYAFNWEMF